MRLGAETPKYFKADLIDQANDLIYAINENGETPVIIIDEAHLIPGRATFEEIRLLTNFQLDDRNLMAVIVMAQPEIEKRLNRKDYEAFRQRIAVKHVLSPLNRSETSDYIDHRIKFAGGNPALFKDKTRDLIYAYTGGIPRKINNLCGSALLEGFGRGSKSIGPEIIKDAAKDLGLQTEFEVAA